MYRLMELLIALSLVWSGEGAWSRDALSKVNTRTQLSETEIVIDCTTQQDIGQLGIMMTNDGSIATGQGLDPGCYVAEDTIAGCEFPAFSRRIHMYYAGIMVGGIVAGDTLVTHGYVTYHEDKEFRPNWIDGHRIKFASSLNQEESAVSESDIIVEYTDTAVQYLSQRSYDFLETRLHRPLGLQVTQRSYAWSYTYAADIVFFDLILRNISENRIQGAFIGLYFDGDVHYAPITDGLGDDVTGFITSVPAFFGCNLQDTLNLGWIADNDGDPINGEWAHRPVIDPITQSARASTRSIIAARILQYPGDVHEPSYNWWAPDLFWAPYDYGPMRRDRYRNFRTGGSGDPLGDRNKYYLLSNGDRDLDQVYTLSAFSWVNNPWILPAYDKAFQIADGHETRFILSVGPLDIEPGAEVPFSFAVFAGENFHNDPSNGANLPNHPDLWYQNVDFSDLHRNALWAQWIYDNPGVDTDGDGDSGAFRVCVLDSDFVNGEWVANAADTQWYKGDGIPDWRAAGPPPPPKFWITPTLNGLHVRFNGQNTENARDVLTQTIDFEGYNIYVARDDRSSSYSLLASYDRYDFDKLTFDWVVEDFVLLDTPFSLEELRCLYGSGPDPCADSSFAPVLITRSKPFIHPEFADSIFYFQPHGRNVSDFGRTTPITRRFPDAVDPRTIHPDSITDDMYTDDGYLKFYEYQYQITDLLPTVPYWVNVTAFDFGSPEGGLDPLESSVTVQSQMAWPLHERDVPAGEIGEVYVYPNPYRIDAGYRARGYEGRTQEDRMDDKVRAIWFANLPPVCTIEIFTIDGDQVRTIEHNKAPGDPSHSHHAWDLINRNFQRVVSGLYYWVVSSPDGDTQMGKLAIVR